MARIVLATVVVAALVAAVIAAVLGVYAVRVAVGTVVSEETSSMQKIAFALLVALTLYVALQGAST